MLSPTFLCFIFAAFILKNALSFDDTTSLGLFESIRIKVHYALENEDKKLRRVIEESLTSVTSLLSVKPLKENLLLSRIEACGSFYMDKNQTRKCFGIKKNYRSEYCWNKMDSFQIPEEHLNSMNIYDKSGNIEASSIHKGSGIPGADFVLYVSSRNTEYCQPQNIIAYSSHCRLSEEDERPVAGYVNFCPYHLEEKTFFYKKLLLTTVHELLHTLGFSSELFPKFKECDNSGCTAPKVTQLQNGRTTIILRSVVKAMQLHFDCNNSDFGAPLALTREGENSHWNPLVLHQSIMTPKFSEMDQANIDPITAALFQDTGWYKVNMSAVKDFQWGKNSGCHLDKFTSDCSFPYTCSKNEVDSTGCDFKHSFVSRCKETSRFESCGLYDHLIVNCQEDIKTCLVVEETWNHGRGQCFDYRCDDNSFHVEVQDRWVLCPPGSQVNIQFLTDLKVLRCPSADIVKELCTRKKSEDQKKLGLHEMLFRTSSNISSYMPFWVRLTTPTTINYNQFNFENEKVFNHLAIRRVTEAAKVPLAWIRQYKMLKRLYFFWLYFEVSPPFSMNSSSSPAAQNFENFKNLVSKGNLTMDLFDINSLKSINLSDEPKEPVKGILAIYLLTGVFFSCVVVASCFTTIYRAYYAKHITGREH